MTRLERVLDVLEDILDVLALLEAAVLVGELVRRRRHGLRRPAPRPLTLAERSEQLRAPWR